MPKRPRIALIHAVTVAMAPIHAAFARDWREAELVNVLDDGLLSDRERDGAITPAMCARFADLARYAHGNGADAILFTCSAFGAAIEHAAARVPIPVLKPNEAMFEAALAVGGRIVMLGTSAVATASLQEEFRDAARAHANVRLDAVVVPAAMEALKAGDTEDFNRLLAERAAALPRPDAIMLAHFSTARAAPAVRAATGVPVLTAPDTAVEKLKRLLAA